MLFVAADDALAFEYLPEQGLADRVQVDQIDGAAAGFGDFFNQPGFLGCGQRVIFQQRDIDIAVGAGRAGSDGAEYKSQQDAGLGCEQRAQVL